ncbi:MAG: 50S ribosomal protein L19e [Candidatus Aenigmarchaeota archaeon]|nr:50S ribosomal protein L19e [Candidatus Aenigmarchaeota archaeon]
MTSIQKKMAAKVMKTGMSKIWLDPAKMKDIEKAITKWDIRKIIKKGEIKVLPGKVKFRVAYKHRKIGPGSKKGKKYAIVPRKRRWMSTVKPQRRMLKELKSAGQLDNVNYRKLYNLVKGGMFRSRAHLKLHIEQNNMLKK